MMDVLYPLAFGSLSKNLELRYSLRSLKFIEHDRIFIAGRRPGFLKNINFVKTNEGNSKQENIKNAILRACDSDITENFIYMNDDFLFIKPTTVKSYCYDKTFDEHIRDRISSYAYSLKVTQRWLKDNNLPTINYEPHYPMVFNKYKFKELFKDFVYDKPYLYRSIYGNYYGIDAEPTRDFKLYKLKDFKKSELRDFISISDKMIFYSEFQDYLEETFPDESEYEI